MKVIANNNRVEFLCEFCGASDAVKDGLSPTGFIRKFRPFQRKHERCEWRAMAEESKRRAGELALSAISKAKAPA